MALGHQRRCAGAALASGIGGPSRVRRPFVSCGLYLVPAADSGSLGAPGAGCRGIAGDMTLLWLLAHARGRATMAIAALSGEWPSP